MHNEPEPNPNFAHGEDIRSRTFEFACAVVMYGQQMFERGGVLRVMAPQLVNCSTSAASMLEEANAAESRRDFISKCAIGLKEARETRLRLRICARVDHAGERDAEALVGEADQIVKVLSAIVRNTRRNAGIRVGVLAAIAMLASVYELLIAN